MSYMETLCKKYGVYLLIVFVSEIAFAQEKGEAVPGFKPDSVITFHSPRPLISIPPSQRFYENGWGFNITLSNNGFGFGLFMQRAINKDLNLIGSLLFSGARNTDELDYYFPDLGIDSIPGKIHRLTLMPLTFGLEQNLFTNILTESFKPYLCGGIGPAFIFASPYTQNWFTDVVHQDTYVRFAGYIGIGANFSSKSQTIMGVNIRYYYIPFGSHGLESIIYNPIKDFGGLFITLNVGIKY